MEEQLNLIYGILIGGLLAFVFAVAITLFVVIYKRNLYQKEIEVEVMQKNNRIKIFRTIVETQQKEQEKIAHNIHDSIGPMLTALKMNIMRQKEVLPISEKDQKELQGNAKLIDEIIDLFRATCQDLAPRFLHDHGLMAALKQFSALVNQNKSVNISLHGKFDHQDKITSHELLSIYRICMELLNNTLKHAKATKIELFIIEKKHELDILLDHDGDPLQKETFEQLSSGKSLGITTLKSRLAVLEGLIYINETKAEPKIDIKIPLNLNKDEQH